MKLSVVTTVYNRPEHFRLFLHALALQSRRPDEVVVGDDGSDAPVAARLETLLATSGFAGKVVHQPKNGFRAAAARNLALREVTGDYVVFADCDIALLPDALALHESIGGPGHLLAGNRALLSKTQTDALFAAPAPGPGPDALVRAYGEADQTELQEAARLFAQHVRRRRWHLARPHKPKLLGCHFSLTMADIRRVNGFDENFVGWGYEDDDFARRLYKVGIRPVSVIESAHALHLWHPSLAPVDGGRHRDRANRAYFRRWFVPAYCRNGLQKTTPESLL
ncbi:MAG: glycosyltransferase [Kiritimatiellae bacterium]|nr:glycosyltransferase [Kiritimatiellia bacterium]